MPNEKEKEPQSDQVIIVPKEEHIKELTALNFNVNAGKRGLWEATRFLEENERHLWTFIHENYPDTKDRAAMINMDADGKPRIIISGNSFSQYFRVVGEQLDGVREQLHSMRFRMDENRQERKKLMDNIHPLRHQISQLEKKMNKIMADQAIEGDVEP